MTQTLVLAAACAGAAGALACGPDLDYDTWPHAERETSFLSRMLEAERKAKRLPEANDLHGDAAIVATEPLLKPLLPATPEGERVLARWRTFRKAIAETVALEDARRERETLGETSEAPHRPAIAQIPEGLPPVFALYEAGMLSWRQGREEEARTAWRKILELPEDQRRPRAVNAAYMLGRSLVGNPAGEPEDACAKAMAQCRAFAAAGCPDPEGLAAASFGWEAFGPLRAKDYEKAIPLYFTQAATGDHGALVSLNLAVAKLMDEDDAMLARIARDDAARRIVSAVIVNRHGILAYWHYTTTAAVADQSARWMSALETAGVAQKEDSAILAWFAYESGRYARAESLAAGSPSPMCAWIRAKMALRRGDEKTARSELEKSIAGFDHDDAWAGASLDGSRHAVAADGARCELGDLRRKQGEFLAALDLYVAGGANGRADELADRVLTVDELKAWVDRHPVDVADPAKTRDLDREVPWENAGQFRWLLARRLARVGRWAEARPYFPPERQVPLDDYLAALATAQAPATPRPAQAEAWWRAAQRVHSDGLVLLGTQCAPDWAVYDGVIQPWAGASPILTAPHAPTEEERRIAASAPTPDERWHYRRLALDHAWKACELLDDDTDLLALRLWTAGRWVAARDPGAADRFYKALVRRCGNTAFGRDADKRRWFPPNPPGQAQPPIHRKTPTPSATWRSRVKAHLGLVVAACAAFAVAGVCMGAWCRKRRRK